MNPKLKQIISKIQEVVPSMLVNENAQIIHFDHSVEYFKQYRQPELQDLLLSAQPLKSFYIDSSGRIFEWADDEFAKAQYDLTKSFIENLEQSEELTNFLYQLIVEK